jgi:hypothetical protein
MASINLSAADFLPVVGGGNDNQVFVKSRKFMRGAGLFTTLGAFLLPIISKLAGYGVSRAADFAKDTSANLIAGNSFRDSIKSSARNVVDRVGGDIQRKVSGGGRITKKQSKSVLAAQQKKKIRDIFARF